MHSLYPKLTNASSYPDMELAATSRSLSVDPVEPIDEKQATQMERLTEIVVDYTVDTHIALLNGERIRELLLRSLYITSIIFSLVSIVFIPIAYVSIVLMAVFFVMLFTVGFAVPTRQFARHEKANWDLLDKVCGLSEPKCQDGKILVAQQRYKPLFTQVDADKPENINQNSVQDEPKPATNELACLSL